MRKDIKIAGIILLAIIILFLILRFLFGWFWGPMFKGVDYDIPEFPEDEYNLPEQGYPGNNVPSNPEAPARTFDKSDKLTRISFTRSASISDGDGDEQTSTDIEIQLVLMGYLREVPTLLSDEPVDYERNYVFDEDSVEWNIYAKEYDADPECVYTYTLSEEGSDEASNIGDSSVSETYRKVMISFSGATGQPENSRLSLDGALMINLDETNKVEVYDPSPNIHAICDGHQDSITFTEERNIRFEFPLVITNVDITKKLFSGSETLDEDDGIYSSKNVGLDADVTELPYTITEIEPVLWDVAWEINLP